MKRLILPNTNCYAKIKDKQYKSFFLSAITYINSNNLLAVGGSDVGFDDVKEILSYLDIKESTIFKYQREMRKDGILRNLSYSVKVWSWFFNIEEYFTILYFTKS
ncbi:MAG: hypothetical protein KA799_01260 [Bacteroidales bacterium]|nr:hypothetical protein [Bacteroidales bacterium]